MKAFTALCFLLTSLSGLGQKDTIQVSTQSAIMIFPSDISDRLLGDDITFFMSEKKDEGSSFSSRIVKLFYSESLKAKNRYTHLTVITIDGNSYEFTLEYAKDPRQKTWYIKPDQAVTNILGKPVRADYQAQEKYAAEATPPISGDPEPKVSGPLPDVSEDVIETARPTAELYASNPMEYYRLRSFYMQFDKAKLPRFYNRSGNLFLWLKGVYFNENEIYMQFKIENMEGVDFDLNFLKFGVATAYQKSSSNQKTEIEPVFRFKVPQRVEGNSENHFVIVFKKFSLDRNKVLIVDLDEENGNRNISLEIDHHLINNPFKIK